MEALMAGLYGGDSGIRRSPELCRVGGVRAQVSAQVTGADPMAIPRKFRRSMSDMSIYATLAANEALGQAGLAPSDCETGRMGLSLGSTVGSPIANEQFFKELFEEYSVEHIRTTFFFKVMNHSCAANVAQVLGIRGRILSPSSACATGCQAIGYGAEMIALGKQEMMLCGGTDEFHPLTVATFDLMNAASVEHNDRPSETPRPFDAARDGVVCGEGCGIVLMESLASARKRGARILGEILGFATTSDPSSIANPDSTAMGDCMRLALEDAGLPATSVDYVNAHATGTVTGDMAESHAIFQVFGGHVPVSSLKGHLGHTMAASGALELAATVDMMNRGLLIPTRNLENPDMDCGALNFVQQRGLQEITVAIKNSFAFGGVNSSIILGRYQDDGQGNYRTH
jgi:3-oxoacyl-[acyl-carrier-protein] synthase II